MRAFKSMSADELWRLHEQVTSTLIRRIAQEKAKLEGRLRRLEYDGGALGANGSVTGLNRTRRPYPKVLPKYQNPNNPSETWAGRGKQPRWVRAQLDAGKKLEHLAAGHSDH
jgi:DNA-binding protein H-NS